MNLHSLWRNIVSHLNSGCPDWKKKIEGFGQVDAIKRRRLGETWSNNEVFEALLLSVLSADRNWEQVERIKPELKEPFCEFDLEAYAKRPDSYVDKILVPWFKERKAGWRDMQNQLVRLIRTARKLLEHSTNDADSYFRQLMFSHDKDAKEVALCLGVKGRKHKLPSLGVPLAAEALKNLGFDVAKPDRHVCRAIRAFGLVDFGPEKNGRYQYGDKNKQLETMTRVEEIAHAAGEPIIAYVDNAIWMLVAQEERRLADWALAELAGTNPIQRKDPSGLLALLDSWEKDGDVEEQRETLEYLIRALDENRPEGYKLFPPELKGTSW